VKDLAAVIKEQKSVKVKQKSQLLREEVQKEGSKTNMMSLENL